MSILYGFPIFLRGTFFSTCSEANSSRSSSWGVFTAAEAEAEAVRCRCRYHILTETSNAIVLPVCKQCAPATRKYTWWIEHTCGCSFCCCCCCWRRRWWWCWMRDAMLRARRRPLSQDVYRRLRFRPVWTLAQPASCQNTPNIFHAMSCSKTNPSSSLTAAERER